MKKTPREVRLLRRMDTVRYFTQRPTHCVPLSSSRQLEWLYLDHYLNYNQYYVMKDHFATTTLGWVGSTCLRLLWVSQYGNRSDPTPKRTSSYTSEGTSTTMPTCPSRSIGSYVTNCAVSGSTPSNCTTNPTLPLSSKSGWWQEPRGTRDNCCTAASRGARAHATTTRCAEPTTAFRLAASVGESTTALTIRFRIWTGLSRRDVRASTRLYAGGGSCFHVLWRTWRIRDCWSVWCSENWWGARAVLGGRKKWMGRFLDDLRAFGINADQWTTTAQDEWEWRRMAEQVVAGHFFMAKWIAAKNARAGLLRYYAVLCPNVTERTKGRIAQSKRARVGSLVTVD